MRPTRPLPSAELQVPPYATRTPDPLLTRMLLLPVEIRNSVPWWFFALAVLVLSAICLRASQPMSGTDVCYAATRRVY
eukprot:95506-Rhodomonas_salina.2